MDDPVDEQAAPAQRKAGGFRRDYEYPFACSSCGRTITHPSRRTGKGLAHGSRGLCQSCYKRWKLDGKPEPASAYRAQFTRSRNVAYPRLCSSCRRMMVRSKASAGEGLAMAGGGLRENCHARWLQAGKPCPPERWRTDEPKKGLRRTYPFPCEGCGVTLAHSVRVAGGQGAHVARGLCSACYHRRWRQQTT